MKVYSPTSLQEAYEILASTEAKILAGGTNLMVLWNSNVAKLPQVVVDIWRMKMLAQIDDEGEVLRIGARCTYTQIINNPLTKNFAPALVDAARTIGAVQIQNRGTIGGNVVNASPAGDSLPVLVAFDAKVEIGSLRGVRTVALEQFYTGYRKTVLAADEMVTAILLPKQREDEVSKFYKIGTRAAQAISKVVMAARAVLQGGLIAAVGIGVGSVAPTVIRAKATEGVMLGRQIDDELVTAARRTMMNEVKPITDVRSTEFYRRTVSGNLVAKFLREIV